jgi:hypothetical protein
MVGEPSNLKPLPISLLLLTPNFFPFFFSSIWGWTQGLTLAKQGFYHLSHVPSPQFLKSLLSPLL